MRISPYCLQLSLEHGILISIKQMLFINLEQQKKSHLSSYYLSFHISIGRGTERDMRKSNSEITELIPFLASPQPVTQISRQNPGRETATRIPV